MILRSPDRLIVSVDLAAARERARRWLPAVAFVAVAGSGAILAKLPAWLDAPKAQASARPMEWVMVETQADGRKGPTRFASMEACFHGEQAAVERWRALPESVRGANAAPSCFPVTE